MFEIQNVDNMFEKEGLSVDGIRVLVGSQSWDEA
jgi:hypothetical protein